MLSQDLAQFLQETTASVRQLLREDLKKLSLEDGAVLKGALSYFGREGKMMRPMVLLLACGVAGSDLNKALKVAAALEVEHVFTLVHDDIIDKSELRRGDLSLHRLFQEEALQSGASTEEASNYGNHMALLIGDLQQGWGCSLILGAAEGGDISFKTAGRILSRLGRVTLPRVIEGQILDLRFEQQGLNELKEEEILRMLILKTAHTFGFAGWAGVTVAYNERGGGEELASLLAEFGYHVGVAFQLADDLQDFFVEPRYEDIKQGKKTLLAKYAYEGASPRERELFSAYGQATIAEDKVQSLRESFRKWGAVEKVQRLAQQYANQGKAKIAPLPDSRYKQLLCDWADWVLNQTAI